MSGQPFPYRNVRHAINAAYASEVLEVQGRTPTVWKRGNADGTPDRYISSQYQEYAAPGGPKPSSYLEQFEFIAEGHWCLALIRDTLDDDAMTVIDARYGLKGDIRLEVRKYAACVRLAGMIQNLDGKPDHDYTIAAVAEWAGFGALNPKVWSDHLGVTERTLRNWRRGRSHPGDPFGVGIEDRLRVYLADAEYKLETVMADRGLVFRENGPICHTESKDNRKPLAAWSGVLRLNKRVKHEYRAVKVAAEVFDRCDRLEAQYRRAG